MGRSRLERVPGKSGGFVRQPSDWCGQDGSRSQTLYPSVVTKLSRERGKCLLEPYEALAVRLEEDAHHIGLREMLREQERVIDHQVHALEDHDQKSEHMIKVCIAALAGGVTLATILLRGPHDVSLVTLAPFSGAAILNLASLVLFVDAYVGFRRQAEAHIGPDPAWIAQKADDAEWTLEEHLLSIIADHPRYSDHNLLAMERTTKRRRYGIYLLLASITAYAGAYIFILQEVMLL